MFCFSSVCHVATVQQGLGAGRWSAQETEREHPTCSHCEHGEVFLWLITWESRTTWPNCTRFPRDGGRSIYLVPTLDWGDAHSTLG